MTNEEIRQLITNTVKETIEQYAENTQKDFEDVKATICDLDERLMELESLVEREVVKKSAIS